MDGINKFQRITDEVFNKVVDVDAYQGLLTAGWQVRHIPGTAFVSLVHPNGGARSLLEVITYGGLLTVGEADEVAKLIAQLLIESQGEASESLKAQHMQHISNIINEFKASLLQSIGPDSPIAEHVNGHFSSLRLAILESLSGVIKC